MLYGVARFSSYVVVQAVRPTVVKCVSENSDRKDVSEVLDRPQLMTGRIARLCKVLSELRTLLHRAYRAVR